MKFFHVTTPEAADAIAREGFRDNTGSYGLIDFTLTGVWVSDSPLGPNEGARGDVLLEIDVAATFEDLDYHELKEDGKPYREWCLPASLLNAIGRIVRRYDDPVDWV